MTGREFQRLLRKHIFPHMDGFVGVGGLMFHAPLKYVLRGFCLQPSAFSKADFCVDVFMQPLFLPSDSITFEFGGRLGTIRGRQDCWWSMSDAREARIMQDVLKLMQREGPVVFGRFKSLRDVANRAVQEHGNPHALRPPEIAAYAAILLDDAGTAQRMFDCAERRFAADDDRRDWVLAVMDRIRSMRRTFEQSPAEARSILHRWRDQTAAKLRIAKFLDAAAVV